jgi:hypothetical protein
VLGAQIPPAEHLAGVDILTTMDLDVGIELFGPASPSAGYSLISTPRA